MPPDLGAGLVVLKTQSRRHWRFVPDASVACISVLATLHIAPLSVSCIPHLGRRAADPPWTGHIAFDMS